MTGRWLHLLGPIIALALATPAWAAAPVIERVDVETASNDYVGAIAWFDVQVRDADGPSDLASVQIGPNTVPPGGVSSFTWQQKDDGLIEVSGSASGVTGTSITIAATDAGGLQDSLSVAVPALPTQPVQMTSPSGDYPIVPDANVTFAWSSLPPAASSRLEVACLTGSLASTIWQIDLGPVASVGYNTDGNASEPLRPGHRYVWSLTVEAAVDDGVSDPRIHTKVHEDARGSFMVFSERPVLEQAKFTRASDKGSSGALSYGEYCLLTIVACDLSKLVSPITVTRPDGASFTVTQWWWNRDPHETEVECLLRTAEETAAPVPGVYTVTLLYDGTPSTFSTPAAPPVPEMTLVSPGPNAVIDEVNPTFIWQSGLPHPQGSVYVGEPAVGDSVSTMGSLWYTTLLDSESEQATLDPFSWLGALTPGHSYSWTASSESTEADPAGGSASITTWVAAGARFSVYASTPTLPELPGKLAESVQLSPDRWCSSVLQYSPDGHERLWLEPLLTHSADWSPDGTRLLYSNDGTATVDSLDGTEPRVVPTVDSADCLRWSPDGARIVYGTPYGEMAGVTAKGVAWASVDSSQYWVLVADGVTSGQPEWSPDGEWISYCRRQGDTEAHLWLISPEGGDSRPVAATSIVGYDGYRVTWMSSHAWAPDGQRLAVQFDAQASGEPTLSGIGIISFAGGVLRPVFVAPAGVVGEARPQYPRWSPDGASLVFASAHHLPVNPAWAQGGPELGVELWMVPADGSTAPLRLTYDDLMQQSSSWWGPTPFPDVPRGNWAYVAIAACQRAGIVSGYADGYRPADPVTRDQMAVYIARGLAGGDLGVPSAPAGAVLPDVPEGNWAAKYIAYCKDRSIVQGYSDGYHPIETVDRSQMAVYVARAVAGSDAQIPVASTASFSDVATSFWAFKHVEYAKAQGIVSGYSDGTYRPDVVVTRDQMAVYVARAFRLIS